MACIKAKKIVDFNNVDLIYTNVNRIDLGAILSKKFQLPHVWHIREFGDLDYDLISLKKDYIKYMNENTNVFLSISNAVKEAWIRKGINKQKIKMIYDGIDMNNIPPKIYKKSNFVNIIFAGSISETKQQIQLINALKQFPTDLRNSIHVDFFGTGTNKYLSYLKRIIDRGNCDVTDSL
ncbi:hypothetical protein P9G49_14555 [Heyndrickxia coagulans]|uniref:hypothetical protein n=1 Tax=Heyndrickxia coagulans TaxID=1398 RepID=UPI002E0833FE|nr:hypothetical protein [Heyndrickxia coagulans]